MIALEKVLAELKSESLGEDVAGNGTNYCLVGMGNNYCLFGSAQPNISATHEELSKPNPEVQALNLAPVNYCLF